VPEASAVAVAVAPAPGPSRPAADVGLGEVADVWPAVLETIAGDFSLLAAALGNARPAELSDGQLVVAFAPGDSFNRRVAADNADHRRALGEALEALTGARLRLVYEHPELGEEAVVPELRGDELVARIVQEFDAEEIIPDPMPDPVHDPEGPGR
jgi:hypothetical protein